ncbi:MFS transporter [Colwelliaceae bacterium 6441]
MTTKLDGQIQPRNWRGMFAYNLPVAGAYLLFMPIGIVLQGIYATHYGIALSAIATVFFISRIFDAVTDPVIGYVADLTRAKGINRKWWIGIGGIGLVISGYFLYAPPEQISINYFMFWSLSFYLSWTIFDISHYAWGTELTKDPAARVKIFSIRGSMVYVGAISFYVLPVLPIFETTEFTPETLKYAVSIAGIYMLPALLIAMFFVPSGEFIHSGKKESIVAMFKSVLTNKPFVIYVAIYMLTGIGGGIWISLTFIVFNSYYGIGESIALIYFLGSVVGMCGLPFWLWLSNKFGKKISWSFAQCINIVCFAIPLFVVPGEYAFVFLLISTIGIFFSEGCRQGVLPSLLADIVDYGTWKFGEDKAASYFALNTLLQKMSIGIGAGFGLMLLSWFGFDPATTKVGDEDARLAVQLAFCVVPMIVVAVSLLFLSQMRITARHSEIIRKRLALRAKRSSLA